MREVRVAVQLYGQALAFTMTRDGTTVLEASRAAGLHLPSSCEVGSCATCRARLVTGAVTHKSNIALDDDELAAGYVLACQCLPASDDISLDFDVCG